MSSNDPSFAPPNVPGVEYVLKWWGEWIGFHDFYLLSAPKSGDSAGEMRIHGWVGHSDVDERGYYRISDHCVVRIALDEIREVRIEAEEGVPPFPSIIFHLEFAPTSVGWQIEWSSSYGCQGSIEAQDVSLLLEPGKPSPTV